jgi:hypothetical protein
MKWIGVIIGIFIATYEQSSASMQSAKSYWEFPVIPDIGPVHRAPGLAFKPDPNTQYRVVFDITGLGDPNKINPGLGRVAFALNLLGAAHVPMKNIRFVAVLHADALNSLKLTRNIKFCMALIIQIRS